MSEAFRYRREESCTLPSECRSCKDPIVWVIWPRSGKRMPIDAIASKTGDIVVTHKKSENKLHAEKFDPASHPPPRKRYTSHFATCPNASEHRGQR
jgi:hypothetical protein